MVLIKSKPTSPGRRHVVRLKNFSLQRGSVKSRLLKRLKRSGGRNSQGKITVNHIGGGSKRKYRLIDFKRNKDDISAVVKKIEYDPNRSSNIALVLYRDGEKKYILCPKGVKVNDRICSGSNVEIKIGNALPMKHIPVGSFVHNIEMKPGKGGQIARSAGSSAQIISRESGYVVLRLKSGEIRKIHDRCRATLGEVGNHEYMLQMLGKAGANRWRGVRPSVRGTAMNPVDHPHGGGEGKNFGKHPVSPNGIQTKGKKTRKKKYSNKFILRFRSKK